MRLLKLFLSMVAILSLISVNNLNAQQVKSYMQGETQTQTPYGPISQYPQGKQATTVTWKSNGNIELMDGTIWKPAGQALDGSLHYTYVGSSLALTMPDTKYTDLYLAQDYSLMRVVFVFGVQGMYQQMSTYYSYLGDGAQPAHNYINSGYNNSNFGFGFGF